MSMRPEPRLLETAGEGVGIAFEDPGSGETVFQVDSPVAFELFEPGQATLRSTVLRSGYDECEIRPEGVLGRAEVQHDGGAFTVSDTWTRSGASGWSVEREVITAATEVVGVRLLLEVRPGGFTPFRSYRHFAPSVLFDMNDLDGDGVEDYLDTQTLHYRDDRLTARAVLSYDDHAHRVFVLSRSSSPSFDSVPERQAGQVAFLQRTDIGSLGLEPDQEGGLRMVAAYPFAEGERSHALLAKERPGWGAYWPLSPGNPIAVTFAVEVESAADVHRALWSAWRGRLAALDPTPVELPVDFAELTRLRLGALADYYVEQDQSPRAAGFVLNCHPQDGVQISNVIQFGFTGQNTLNGYNFLRAAGSGGPAEYRRMGLNAIEFFVRTVADAPRGLSYGLYNTDLHRYGTWWTGLLLPLAYANPGDDLARLMGPLYEHLREVIEALENLDGTYLRCVAEDYHALIQAVEYERRHGVDHPGWTEACKRFGDFLVASQCDDGSWYRAYSFSGEPITEPARWFGRNELTQKSSTACVVPFLLSLSELTGDSAYAAAASRAGAYVQEKFVDGLKFNGGVLDSLYTQPQLVDSESIMFAFRAMRSLAKKTGDEAFAEAALRAMRVLVTWIWLWDVPLPPASTLAQYGFRSTGWQGCDTPGSGYVHPFALTFLAELVDVAVESADADLLRIAVLLQAGCNETVATPSMSWGYAAAGLQEEGHFLSWWFADDPMFSETAFGGRGKGEGNKTCFPWVPAVAVNGQLELQERYGVSSVADIARRGSTVPRTPA